MGSTQILILLGMTLTSMIVFAVIIVFSLRGRGKKSKMKHGSLSSGYSTFDQPSPAPSLTSGQTGGLDATLASPQKHPSAFNQSDTKSAETDSLNMDILNNLGGTATNTPPPSLPQTNSAPSLPEQPVAEQPITPPPPAEPEELLRLLRDQESGQLIIQIGSNRYTKLSEISDKKIGQFILKLAAHYLRFTNGMIVNHAGVKSVYTPKNLGVVPSPPIATPVATPSPSPTSPPPPPTTPSPPSVKAETTLSPVWSSQQPSPPPDSAKPRGLFGFAKPDNSIPSMMPVINLAQEINDIVQRRLKTSPLANNKIEIVSAPDGGIRINVNGTMYASPDDVADAEVKALIKEAIKEWERS